MEGTARMRKPTLPQRTAVQSPQVRLIAHRLAVQHASLARWMAQQYRAAARVALWIFMFASAVISEGAPDRTVAENVGGQGRPPCESFAKSHEIAPPPDVPPAVWLPMLPPVRAAFPQDGWMLAAMPSFTECAMLGFLVVGAGILLAIYQRVNSAKKEFMGEVVERVAATAADKLAKQDVNIVSQPIKVQAAVQFITHPELEERLSGYARTDDLHSMERRIVGKLETDFRDLDKKRSYSIGNLHEHLTGTTKALTEKIAEGDDKMHDRLEAMSTTLRAESDTKFSEVREDISELPGRVITLLHQTGQIGGTKR